MLVLGVIFFFLLTACERSTHDRLVGRWELEGKDWQETVELFRDGGYKIDSRHGWRTGEWRVVNSKQMAIDLGIYYFSFKEKYLILVDVNGEVYRFRRK
jgi:hypothetical protein